MNLFDLKDKLAIVTGGNGGIGKGIAEGFAEAGSNIVIAARNQNKTEEALNKINKKFGIKTLGIQTDISEESQIKIDKIELKNCYIAIASKDMSKVNIKDVNISMCNVGFAAYQKKPEHGPSALSVSSFDMSEVDTPYIIEEGSTFNKKIDNYYENVWGILYDEN